MSRKIISRQEAINFGKVRYFTGEPCSNGHVAERYTRNKNCVECSKLSKRKGIGEFRESGATRYTTDEPCPKGHVGERYVANGACVVCHREQRRAYYHSSKFVPIPKDRPRYSLDCKEPIATILFREMRSKGMTMKEIADKSGLALNSLENLRKTDGPYGARMTTIHHLAYAAGATLLIRTADGRIIDPNELE